MPNESKPFNVFVDTSQQGTGAFLAQKDENNKFILLNFFSKRMLSKQPPTYMEMSGIKAATRKWQTFSGGSFDARHFHVCRWLFG